MISEQTRDLIYSLSKLGPPIGGEDPPHKPWCSWEKARLLVKIAQQAAPGQERRAAADKAGAFIKALDEQHAPCTCEIPHTWGQSVVVLFPTPPTFLGRSQSHTRKILKQWIALGKWPPRLGEVEQPEVDPQFDGPTSWQELLALAANSDGHRG